MTGHLSHYRPMIADLARRALAMPAPPLAHRPRAGERRFEMEGLRDAARLMLGEPVDAGCIAAPPTSAAVRFVDGFGHSRPVYRYFAAYLYRAAAASGDLALEPDTHGSAGDDPAVDWWRWLCGLPARAEPSITQGAGDDPAPLHRQSVDDAIDHWTYRELVAIHALDRLAERDGRGDWRRAVRRAALYHTQHTQPDYTTYQPWGLAAFLRHPDTASLAEQQLHDVATHLSVEGGRGAVLPGLLLADAWAALR